VPRRTRARRPLGIGCFAARHAFGLLTNCGKPRLVQLPTHSMPLAVIDLIRGADILIYPLALCSLVLVFILCERGWALRRSAILPDDLEDSLVAGRPALGDEHSVLGRIVRFARAHPGDSEGVRAFARLEVSHMERGLPYLEVIYAGAPLIGLTGTVWSLVRVFSSISGATGLPDPVQFTSGVSLALSATIIGLSIAIPALIGGGVLQRRVDTYAAQLDVLLARLLAEESDGRRVAAPESAEARA
jgi:biopolymer transport protein ExbB